jgi:Ca2+-binding EF-hand superfamily protein
MMTDIRDEMSPETQQMFDVCDQYCNGEINLHQAVVKYREFIAASDEEIEALLRGFDRDNVIPFPEA